MEIFIMNYKKNMNPWNFTYDKYIISKKDKYFNYIFK